MTTDNGTDDLRSLSERLRALGIDGLDDFITDLAFWSESYPGEPVGKAVRKALDHAETWQAKMAANRAAYLTRERIVSQVASLDPDVIT